MTTRLARLLPISLILVLCNSLPAQQRSNVDLPRLPSISPDGTQILFTWRGDLWKVSAKGGRADRLTSHPMDDSYSAFSRDGKRIAFVSARAGGSNVFLMNIDGTGIRQLTQTDRAMALHGFGTDDAGNEVVTLSAYFEHDAYRSPRPYMVRTDGTNGADAVRVFDAFGASPVVSPDGKRVLFNRGTSGWSRRGYRGADARDVWLFNRADRSFKRLTRWDGNDGRPKWIDDREFVYASDRADNTVNLYRARADDGDNAEANAQRLTNYTDIDVDDFDISADGGTLVFARWNRLCTIDLTRRDAKPVELSILAAEDESDRVQLKDIGRTVSEAQISPDGKTMAYVAYGDVYVRGTEAKAPTRRVTTRPSRERDINWSSDSEKIYYVSDESGIEAIHAASVKLTRSDVKKKYEEATRKSPDTRPTATQPATGPAPEETSTPPEGEKQDAGEQLRRRGVPPGAPAAGAPTTAPGGRAGAGAAEGEPSRWSEAIAFNVELVSKSDVGDTQPNPSPDGKWLAFKRGKGNLYLMDLSWKEKEKPIRPLLKAWSEQLDWRWSPDSRYIAYQTEDENFNSDIWIVKSDDTADDALSGRAKSAVNITRHPDNDFDPRWSADGKILAFRSERVNNEFDVYMVWLDKEIEGLPPNELDQYYKDAVAAAKKRQPLKPATRPTSRPTTSTTASTNESDDVDEANARPRRRARVGATTLASTQPSEPPKPLDLDDAYLRLKRVTTISGDERDLELTPGGDKFIFTATAGWVRSLYSLDRDATEPRRLAAAASGAGASFGVVGVNFAGDQVVCLDSGRAGVVKLPGGEQEFFDIAERIRLDLQAQSVQKFLEASRILGSQYWDEKMNGLDWRGLTNKYLELGSAARTSDEFDFVANKLIGELNGSHLGINAPDPPNPQARPFGRFGLAALREGDVGYKVTWILPDGPADRGKMRLKVGDVITAIDLETFNFGAEPPDTLEGKLAGKTDREVLITFTRDGHELAALITPMAFDRIGDITYNYWRRENARKVNEWSQGKLGYIHILAMSQPSLDVFERDLYAAAEGKSGLIIDVRNNGGGSTADRLLASIMYPRHAYTQARGMEKNEKAGYPQDRLFIQRYDKPIDMLCNEKSFSNAEIISHAFKTLKRGTLIGQTTAGGVISTGGTTLLDGTSVRIPGRAWFLPDGTNLERHGAVPDLVVNQTPEDEVKGEDAQLRAAVEDLMKRVR